MAVSKRKGPSREERLEQQILSVMEALKEKGKNVYEDGVWYTDIMNELPEKGAVVVKGQPFDMFQGIKCRISVRGAVAMELGNWINVIHNAICQLSQTLKLSLAAEYESIPPIDCAKKMVHDPAWTGWYDVLEKHGHLELSVESFALRPRYELAFSDEEREICKSRLLKSGYDISTIDEDPWPYQFDYPDPQKEFVVLP